MVEKLLSRNIQKADVLLLGIEYDKTSSFGKGAGKGPEAILRCFDTQLELYERFTKWSPARHLQISSAILSDIKNKTPELMVKEVSSEIMKKIEERKFVIALGGEHSISIGIFDAWSKTSVANQITIMQIDAHMDLREDDSDYSLNPSKFAHSCVMKRALDMGFKVVQVGIRAYADFELETAKENNLSIFEWPCDENKEMIDKIVNAIKTQSVYITLDTDGIDPAHMPATGTPVQGGLSWNFIFGLLNEVFIRKNVVGADIVEVAPRENDQLTEFGAAQLCYYMIALKFKNK
ncbi:agmatinase [Candidatus Woesearchaeota archaeon]|nr:agmatinase [Candidatus Woesearchaeota archaeon]